MSDEKFSTRAHSNLVANLILENNCEVVAEIGVWTGATVKKVLGSPAKDIVTAYWAVDPLIPVGWGHGKLSKVTPWQWEEAYKKLCRLMVYFPQLKVLRMESYKAAIMFSEIKHMFDLVYIDANHHYKPVLTDIKYWLPLVKPGGIIAGHDYSTKYKGVIKAVDEVFGDNKEVIESVWIKKL